jgi:diguanylate cyclase (GGDEF)-like protein
MVAAISHWLCRAELDRARLVDNSTRVIRARNIAFGATGLILAIAAPKFGPWVLLLFALAVLNAANLDRRVERSPRPELHLLSSFLWVELLTAVGIALSGGHESPGLALMLLPCGFAASRFRPAVVSTLMVVALALIALATIPFDPAGTLANPYPLAITAVLVVAMTACVHALSGAEYEQRGESSVDHLTGLLNRGALARRFRDVAAQCLLTDVPLSLLVGDVDSFKGVNDRHGHAGGDVVLRAIADALRAELRAFELIYRYGGEEFVVVLAGADREPAAMIAERLRAAVETARPGDLDITISFGVATAHGDAIEFEPLFAAADAALYTAKQRGRNRVEPRLELPLAV